MSAGRYLIHGSALGWTLAKAQGIRPIPRERASVKRARVKLRGVLSRWLSSAGRSIAGQLAQVRAKAATAEEIRRILMAIEWPDAAEIEAEVEKLLEVIAREGAAMAFSQLGLNERSPELNLANEKAIEWAKERAGQLVGAKNNGWSVEQYVRDRVRDLVTEAEERGWSVDQLSERLLDAYAFSEDRAAMIATTELAMADVSGNMIAYRESGVVAGKRWILANQGDDKCCDVCESAAADGVIGLGDSFSTGDDAPPGHPNCRCDVVPVLANPIGDTGDAGE